MRIAKFLTFCLFFTVCHLLLYLPPTSYAGPFSVNLTGNFLSVTAEDVPLQDILREIAARGIRVKIDPAINPLVSADFKERPIDQALEFLLKPESYSLLWQTDPHAADRTVMLLAEIHVFQTGRKDLMQTLQPRRSEVITQNNEGVSFVKDEILLFLPPGKDFTELRKLLLAHNATLVASGGLAGLFKVLLPENSDIFAIAQEFKNKLNLDISQPNYAYPLQHPFLYTGEIPAADRHPASYVPADNTAPIAIIDSGLAASSVLEPFVVSFLDLMGPDSSITDTLGHGTQMAYVASGLIKPYGSIDDEGSFIPIIPIRAFDDNGYTTDFKIMAAINFALEHHARVMSLSWGSATRSDFMEKALAYANDSGLVIVASAGNEPTGKPIYPAAYTTVIGVGALEPHGKTWKNSNYGNFVAFYAPGFANLPVGHNGDPGLYAGTSISAAFVANTIAGYLSENPTASQPEIRDYLSSKFWILQSQPP